MFSKARLAFTCGTIAVFSFHSWFPVGKRNSVSSEEVQFPKLPADKFPSCFATPSGLLHIAGITIPILAGTGGWCYRRAIHNKLSAPKSVALRSTAVMGCLLLFDGLSWLLRLLVYGTKNAFILEDEKPKLVSRIKEKNEIMWYRTNQIILPTILTLAGTYTGAFPFLFVPIISWKALWHFWVIYQGEGILLDVGNGPMAPFRQLEAEKGKKHAIMRYCEHKNLQNTAEAEELYDCDMRNK